MSDDIKKPWLKESQKEIKNIINNNTFLVLYPEKYEPVTPCIDFFKGKIKYYRSLDKLKLITVVRGDLKNKELVVENWSPTASMRTLKYFLTDSVHHKARVHQLDFIGAFLQAKVNNRAFVKLDSRHADYFPEYSNYFGRDFILLKSMYGMNKSGNLLLTS